MSLQLSTSPMEEKRDRISSCKCSDVDQRKCKEMQIEQDYYWLWQALTNFAAFCHSDGWEVISRVCSRETWWQGREWGLCTGIMKLKITYNLSHGLGEIVHDQVRLSVVFNKIWTCHAVLHHLKIVRIIFFHSLLFSSRQWVSGVGGGFIFDRIVSYSW